MSIQKKLLILDIDETLIFATESPLTRSPDFVAGHYLVYERPYVREFLKYCSENFEVAVWTTSTEAYAESIIARLFGDKSVLRFIWSRDRCTWVFDEDTYDRIQIKKLDKVRRLGHRVESITVVDDSPNVWKQSYGNLVRVAKFEGDQLDDELLHLPKFLGVLKVAENVRAVEKRNWRSRVNA